MSPQEEFKEIHFVVCYHPETGDFTIDDGSTSAKYPDGTQWSWRGDNSDNGEWGDPDPEVADKALQSLYARLELPWSA
jgi:hypothetical protein